MRVLKRWKKLFLLIICSFCFLTLTIKLFSNQIYIPEYIAFVQNQKYLGNSTLNTNAINFQVRKKFYESRLYPIRLINKYEAKKKKLI